MAELLVRTVDKTHPDPAQDLLFTKRGYVIAAQEDGWPWGSSELSNQDWLIVRVAGVPAADYSGLLAPFPLPDLDAYPGDYPRRAFKLDLDAPTLPQATRTAINARLVVPTIGATIPIGAAVRETVESRVETFVERIVDGRPVRFLEPTGRTTRVVTKYRVAALDPAIAAIVGALQVTLVDDAIRQYTYADVTPELIEAITVPVIAPTPTDVFGDDPRVIG